MQEHKRLKLRAVEFLEAIGCQDIQEEYRLPKIQYTLGKRPRHWATKQYFLFDVVGFRQGQLIAVECGGIYPRKLASIAKQGIKLYILPHGTKKPFLWRAGLTVCARCGNKTAN